MRTCSVRCLRCSFRWGFISAYSVAAAALEKMVTVSAITIRTPTIRVPPAASVLLCTVKVTAVVIVAVVCAELFPFVKKEITTCKKARNTRYMYFSNVQHINLLLLLNRNQLSM